jgi:hypothetical protein
MNGMKTFLKILPALLIVSSCSPSLRVYTDYDREFNIQKYPTYTWAEDKEIESRNNPLYYNELNDKRIKKAVNDQLSGKGYQLVSENPDVLIHYHIVVEDRSEIRTDPYGFYGPYWTRSRTYSYSYRQGTLIIDLMDASNKYLLWRGWAVSVMDQTYDLIETEVMITKAVIEIFEKLPRAIVPEKPVTAGRSFRD